MLVFTSRVLCSCPGLRALEPSSTLGTGELLPAPLLENCSPNSYRWFSEVSGPLGVLSPSFLRQPVLLLHSVHVRRLSGTPVWPAPIANLKVLYPQPFPCGSCRPLRFGLSSPLFPSLLPVFSLGIDSLSNLGVEDMFQLITWFLKTSCSKSFRV